jgi:hypothetical protein
MWARLHRIKFWRFYVPFAKVNFHGLGSISLAGMGGVAAIVGAACIRLDVPADQKQPAMRLVTAKITRVRRRWCNFIVQGNEQAEIEWLFGRLAGRTLRACCIASMASAFSATSASSNADGRLVALRRGHVGQEPVHNNLSCPPNT